MKFKLFTLLIVLFSISTINTYAKISIKVDIIGKGDPIIFIPAMGCSGEMWDETVKHFSKNYTCHSISINGFGGLDAKEGQNFEHVKADIISYLKKNKVNKAVLIGHSFGGTLAIELASSNPGIFSKLIIVDTYSFPLGIFVPGITIEQAQQQSDQLTDALLALSNDAFKSQKKIELANAVTDEKKLIKILDWQSTSNRTVFADAMGIMLKTDHRPELINIKIPTLILGTWVAYAPYGFTKESVEKNYLDQYKNLEDYKVVMADQSKHFIMSDDPNWFNQQLELFLQ